ncbi:MAG: Gldg family protein, partial [Planctomycetota bacterium]
ILSTDAKVNGGFDMARMSSSPPWQLVADLKKQYEVVSVSADSAYPGVFEPEEGGAAQPSAAEKEKLEKEKLDVLLAVLPSSLTQPQLDRFMKYIRGGHAVVIVDDPMPTSAPTLAASAPKPRQGGGPFGGGQPPTPKGDFQSALRDLGIFFPTGDVVWQGFNPHPKLPVPDGMKEVLFVTEGNGAAQPFNASHPVSSGLREVVGLFSGYLDTTSGSSVTMTPLVSTGTVGGTLPYREIWQTNPWGGGGINPRRAHVPTAKEYCLAAIFEGKSGAPNLGFIADMDMIGDSFFQFRKDMGPEVGEDEFDFDNVTLILNMIDHLAGDPDFIELRKRRPVHRRLTAVEEEVSRFRAQSEEEERNAKTAGQTRLDEAQARLDEAVARLNQRTDLDATAKRIMLAQTQEVEQRKLTRAKQRIETERERTVYLARIEKEQKTRNVYFKARLLAVLFPLFPPLILAGIFFSIRWRREQEATIR